MTHTLGTLFQNWIIEDKELSDELRNTKSISILDLPEEIILYIFSYLDPIFLLQRVSLVCKSWNCLVKDPMLWLSLSLDMKIKECNLKCIFIQFPHLQKLSIQQGIVDKDFVEAILSLPNLWYLSLTFCDILTDTEDSFQIFFLKTSNTLRHLDLEGSEVNGAILNKIYFIKSLRFLNLSHCMDLPNRTLIRILENSPHLQLLDLDGINSLKDNTVNSIFKIRFDSIIDLIVDGDYLEDQAFENLNNCSKLSKLNISFCENLTDITLSKIKCLKKLKNLKLRKGSLFTTVGLRTLFSDNMLSHITHLNLSECSLLDNVTLIAIANCCIGLISLSLGWCWEITDKSLCHVVKKCFLIRTMDLTGLVRLQGKFLSYLQKGYLKHLKIIDLEQCGCIKDELLLDLFRARSNIKIFGFWGDIVSPETSERDSD